MTDSLTHWFYALRPKTLSISVIPVITGSALGWVQAGRLAIDIMLVALVAAMLIQIGTNLHNDAADYQRGADDPNTRLGPPRAVAEGWLSAQQVERAAIACFVLAFLIGLYLMRAGGWPIVVLGLVCIAAGYFYTGGPKPVAYTGTGELFVLVFFGLVAVTACAYLQSGEVTLVAALVGLLLGLPATAVLVVNNHRDRENDARVGKNTIAVRFGSTASTWTYALCVAGPFLLLPLVQIHSVARHAWLLPWLALPWALWLVKRFQSTDDLRAMNPLLVETAGFQFVLGLLLSASFLAGLAPG